MRTTDEIRREQEKLAEMLPFAELFEACAATLSLLANIQNLAHNVRSSCENDLSPALADWRLKEAIEQGWSPDRLLHALDVARKAKRIVDAAPPSPGTVGPSSPYFDQPHVRPDEIAKTGSFLGGDR